ncbi:MAG: hypothetical protein WBG02_18705 [Candidatus Acidiferrum sp.]
MRRYLLGTAPTEERAEVEHAYLSDSDQFEELNEAENDLIDAYVRGRLSAADRKEFEKHYLSSQQRRERIQFAAALAEVSRELKQSEAAAEPSFWNRLRSLFSESVLRWQWSLAAAAVIAVLVIAGLQVSKERRFQLAQLHHAATQSAGETQTSTPPNSEAPKTGQSSGPEIAQLNRHELDEFTVQLSAGISRSAGSKLITFAIPKAPWIVFRLILDEDEHSTYAAALETAEGQQIKTFGGLKSQVVGGNAIVVLRVPSNLVQAGDYVITLRTAGTTAESGQDIDTYTFRATKP